MSVATFSLSTMDLNTEQFNHPGCSLGICWIDDECSHVGQLEANTDPVNFRSGVDVGLGQDEGEKTKAKQATQVHHE